MAAYVEIVFDNSDGEPYLHQITIMLQTYL